MGMTIDLAMNNLSEILTEATEDENSVCYVTENDAETLQMAIDTMRKYQKIKEYISIPNRYGTMAECCKKLEYIRKVVEDESKGYD